MSNIKYILSFSEEDIKKLNGVLNTSKPNSKIFTRAKILMALYNSIEYPITIEEIAIQCNTSRTTVNNIRARLATLGFDETLFTHQRELPPVIPRTYGIEEQVISIALSTPPKGHKRWSEQLIATQCVSLGIIDSISQSTIHRFLRKHNISLK